MGVMANTRGGGLRAFRPTALPRATSCDRSAVGRVIWPRAVDFQTCLDACLRRYDDWASKMEYEKNNCLTDCFGDNIRTTPIINRELYVFTDKKLC